MGKRLSKERKNSETPLSASAPMELKKEYVLRAEQIGELYLQSEEDFSYNRKIYQYTLDDYEGSINSVGSWFFTFILIMALHPLTAQFAPMCRLIFSWTFALFDVPKYVRSREHVEEQFITFCMESLTAWKKALFFSEQENAINILKHLSAESSEDVKRARELLKVLRGYNERLKARLTCDEQELRELMASRNLGWFDFRGDYGKALETLMSRNPGDYLEGRKDLSSADIRNHPHYKQLKKQLEKLRWEYGCSGWGPLFHVTGVKLVLWSKYIPMVVVASYVIPLFSLGSVMVIIAMALYVALQFLQFVRNIFAFWSESHVTGRHRWLNILERAHQLLTVLAINVGYVCWVFFPHAGGMLALMGQYIFPIAMFQAHVFRGIFGLVDQWFRRQDQMKKGQGHSFQSLVSQINPFISPLLDIFIGCAFFATLAPGLPLVGTCIAGGLAIISGGALITCSVLNYFDYKAKKTKYDTSCEATYTTELARRGEETFTSSLQFSTDFDLQTGDEEKREEQPNKTNKTTTTLTLYANHTSGANDERLEEVKDEKTKTDGYRQINSSVFEGGDLNASTSALKF